MMELLDLSLFFLYCCWCDIITTTINLTQSVNIGNPNSNSVRLYRDARLSLCWLSWCSSYITLSGLDLCLLLLILLLELVFCTLIVLLLILYLLLLLFKAVVDLLVLLLDLLLRKSLSIVISNYILFCFLLLLSPLLLSLFLTLYFLLRVKHISIFLEGLSMPERCLVDLIIPFL